MLRIGIVGAENSHSRAIARLINVERKIPGAKVTAIWGETGKLAEAVAADAAIPTVVRRPEHLIGLADAAVVDHRHGRHHLPAAKPLLRAGLPLFIDKPFCCRLAEGKRFLAEAARRRVPVTSYGVLPLQKSFAGIRREMKKLGPVLAVTTSGPADLFSKYGGVFFYGIHQVDVVLRAVGLEVTHARINRSGCGGTATLWYRDGLVATMNLLAKRGPGFHFTAICEKGVVSRPVKTDRNPYLTGARNFVRMFRGGRPLYGAREVLAPVAVLEALGKSLESGGRKVKVGRF